MLANTSTVRATRALPCAAPRRCVLMRAENDTTETQAADGMEAAKQTTIKEEAPRNVSAQRPGGGSRSAGVPDFIAETVLPRVDQLRGKQLSEGTTDFVKIMRFNGPAPELINGRLAMFGFFAAIGAESVNGIGILQQLQGYWPQILAFSALITVASIIPIVRGSAIFDDGGGEGFRPGAFNVTNELINGRAAMLGMALIVLYEAASGAPLF